MDDVLDESDDNEETEIDTENEEDEKDQKSQVISSALIQEFYVAPQNSSLHGIVKHSDLKLLMISHSVLC